ncbi:flagellar export chaperone FliS [Paenibacillus antri]|uniref:Flagellar secretion chaperone FliS n=1 Tax=Paenibacillus antri TaxID=2582848 RepID=A0A5R9G894_9BACL|nr:flagellar export chaperone FliS [Paenibacillus antri]TLS50586.1 flagellar export chaperone FliS [Paenibacillus antri]
MIQAQRNKYLETSIQTATPAQLLIMLCDGAIRFCKHAIEALKNQNYEEANEYLGRTQDIVSEFAITLDRSAEISESLSRLYEYFNYRLIQANIKKSPEPAEEVLGYLLDLKETWVQAALLSKQSGAPVAK